MLEGLVSWESFALCRTTTPMMQSRQSEAREASSVMHQAECEDGAMSGTQKVRPTLFYLSSCFYTSFCIFFKYIYIYNMNGLCDLWFPGVMADHDDVSSLFLLP